MTKKVPNSNTVAKTDKKVPLIDFFIDTLPEISQNSTPKPFFYAIKTRSNKITVAGASLSNLPCFLPYW